MAGGTARLQAIDVYRGLALVAMAAYHTCWDLTYYRLIETGIGIDPVWITLQRSILTAFLLLAGASLALAHGNGVRWRGFWKREAILVAAAIAVSVGTWFLFQESFAWFGVLHMIALGSLLCLPFVVAPVWVGAVVAAVVLAAPALFSADAFNPRSLDWIGFFTVTPDTADLVPVFPWLGVMLIGVLGMRLGRALPAFTWTSAAWPVKVLAFMGRWSLILYLVHQPMLFGIITPIANVLNSAEQSRIESFLPNCEASCGVNGDAPFCTRYCQCALDMTVRDNLWNATPEQMGPMSKLCTAMSK